MRQIFISGILFLGSFWMASANELPRMSFEGEMRTWTSTDGRSISARLIGMEGDSVNIRRDDGRSFWLSLENLSPIDQRYVFYLLPAPPFFSEVSANVDHRRTYEWRSRYSGSSHTEESRRQEVEVQLSNRGLYEYPFQVRVWVFVRDEQTSTNELDTIEVLSNAVVPAGESITKRFQSDEVRRSRENYRYLNVPRRTGSDLAGWAVTIHDRRGGILRSYGNRESRIKLAEEFWEENKDLIVKEETRE